MQGFWFGWRPKNLTCFKCAVQSDDILWENTWDGRGVSAFTRAEAYKLKHFQATNVTCVCYSGADKTPSWVPLDGDASVEQCPLIVSMYLHPCFLVAENSENKTFTTFHLVWFLESLSARQSIIYLIQNLGGFVLRQTPKIPTSVVLHSKCFSWSLGF